jgi:hypothetical protein
MRDLRELREKNERNPGEMGWEWLRELRGISE